MSEFMTEGQYEEAVKKWCNTVRMQAKARARSFGKGKTEATHTYVKGRWEGKTEAKLKATVKSRLHKSYGDIDNVSFIIPVHGIFRTYGVGNGQPSGSSFQNRAGKTYIKRSPSDWITDPIDKNFDKFADLTGDYYGDKVLLHVSGMKLNNP